MIENITTLIGLEAGCLQCSVTSLINPASNSIAYALLSSTDTLGESPCINTASISRKGALFSSSYT